MSALYLHYCSTDNRNICNQFSVASECSTLFQFKGARNAFIAYPGELCKLELNSNQTRNDEMSCRNWKLFRNNECSVICSGVHYNRNIWVYKVRFTKTSQLCGKTS